jgi:hypothetical protein
MSLLSVFLAFFFSFLAIQCTGVTDITPLTAASKASQIILGGATKGEHWTVEHSQRLNLLGGALANMGANQATDLTMDFRTGFLLRTPPIQQWLAQGIGTLVAVFVAPLMFRLFMKAYPCIINMDDVCPFSYPSVAAWRATAIAVTDPTFPIPPSSGYFSIAFSVLGAVMSLIKHFCYTGKREWMKKYHPNMMCIALAFVLPQTYCECAPSSRLSKRLANTRTRWYSYGYGRSRIALLEQQESEALRDIWLRCCSWSDRGRGHWRSDQCYLSGAWDRWRQTWFNCCLSYFLLTSGSSMSVDTASME